MEKERAGKGRGEVPGEADLSVGVLWMSRLLPALVARLMRGRPAIRAVWRNIFRIRSNENKGRCKFGFYYYFESLAASRFARIAVRYDNDYSAIKAVEGLFLKMQLNPPAPDHTCCAPYLCGRTVSNRVQQRRKRQGGLTRVGVKFELVEAERQQLVSTLLSPLVRNLASDNQQGREQSETSVRPDQRSHAPRKWAADALFPTSSCGSSPTIPSIPTTRRSPPISVHW